MDLNLFKHIIADLQRWQQPFFLTLEARKKPEGNLFATYDNES